MSGQITTMNNKMVLFLFKMVQFMILVPTQKEGEMLREFRVGAMDAAPGRLKCSHDSSRDIENWFPDHDANK